MAFLCWCSRFPQCRYTSNGLEKERVASRPNISIPTPQGFFSDAPQIFFSGFWVFRIKIDLEYQSYSPLVIECSRNNQDSDVHDFVHSLEAEFPHPIRSPHEDSEHPDDPVRDKPTVRHAHLSQEVVNPVGSCPRGGESVRGSLLTEVARCFPPLKLSTLSDRGVVTWQLPRGYWRTRGWI